MFLMHLIMATIGILIPIGGPIGFKSYLNYETNLSDDSITVIFTFMLIIQTIILVKLFEYV